MCGEHSVCVKSWVNAAAPRPGRPVHGVDVAAHSNTPLRLDASFVHIPRIAGRHCELCASVTPADHDIATAAPLAMLFLPHCGVSAARYIHHRCGGCMLCRLQICIYRCLSYIVVWWLLSAHAGMVSW